MNRKITCSQARDYDLVDYLLTLGFTPAKIVRNQYWFLSPLREEKTPSFKVNRVLNLWWDFGDGSGGNLIDFAIRYHRCTVGEFLRILAAKPICHSPVVSKVSGVRASGEGKVIILQQATLSDSDLLRYLQQRRIPLTIADAYCKEVTFELYGKTFKAIGFANNSGGFELRNARFKGSSSPKIFTSIFSPQEGNLLYVFEGFFDLLSYLTLIPAGDRVATDYLILNSLVFFEQARTLMESYSQVNLFLDNNDAGRRVTRYALSLSSCYRDHSSLYSHHQDLNDLLVFFGKPST